MPLIISSNLIKRLVVSCATIVGWCSGVAALAEPPMPPVPGQPVQQVFYDSSGATAHLAGSPSNLPTNALSAARPVQQVSHERPAPSSHEPSAPMSQESAVSPSERVGHQQYDRAVSPSDASLPLRPSSSGMDTGGDSRGPRAAADGRSNPLSPVTSLTTALSGLAIVLGLFFLASWLLKRALPKSARSLPGEVWEVLGRSSLAARQSVHLVRIGHKLILVSISTDRVETLTEITDPAEVDRLAGICAQQTTESSSSAFANVFQQFQREPVSLGFLRGDDRTSAEAADGLAVQEGRDV